MPRQVHLTISKRSISCARKFTVCLCAVSLLIVLANRVPRFSPSAAEISWVRGAPSETIAKVWAKELYLLPLPTRETFAFVLKDRFCKIVEQPRLIFAAFWDDRLFTRPPPAS
jgi:hypothetical protein